MPEQEDYKPIFIMSNSVFSKQRIKHLLKFLNLKLFSFVSRMDNNDEIVEKQEKTLNNVPSKEQLDKYYRIASKRSIKDKATKAKRKKEYLELTKKIVDSCYENNDIETSYLLIKTLSMKCLQEMINIHKEVGRDIFSSENGLEQASVYISDQSKLEVAGSIIRSVYWGESDWFVDE